MIHVFIILNFELKRTAFIWNIILCDIWNDLTVTFNQFNASCWNKSINLFPKKSLTDPTEILNSSVYVM